MKQLNKLIALFASLAIGAAGAQAFPNRPITIVVGFAAGSPTDAVARSIGLELSLILKQPVIVENKPGASQIIAAAFVAKAPADGHTLFLPSMPNVVAPAVARTLPYSGFNEFEAVSHILDLGLLLVTSTTVPANSAEEFTRLLKANPGKYTYGSSGVGSVNHLVAEAMNQAIGAKTVHVPFKGANNVVQEILAGRIDYGFATASAMDFVSGGRMKALGIGTSVRDPKHPAVPTLQESGLGGIRPSVGFLLLAPKGTSPDIVAKLNQAANQSIASAEFGKRVSALGGIQLIGGTTRDAARYVQASEQHWNALVKQADIKLE